jgi:hypothetical protein
MNVRRVAALLRELAEALEQDDPARKPQRPRKRPLVEPKGPVPEVRPEVVDKVRRALRRKGIVTG